MTQAVERRLPGKARDREEVLREWRELNERHRAAIRERWGPNSWALEQLLAPDPTDEFRWRVRLDCRCIREVVTPAADRTPDSMQWTDPTTGRRLPAGQIVCIHPGQPTPYRAIMEWGERREETRPADPVEPPDWCTPSTWSTLRRKKAETVAVWNVTLSCRHAAETRTRTDWQPGEEPRQPSAAKLRAIRRRVETLGEEVVDEETANHLRRMAAAGWPDPDPETFCMTCSWARPIVAYERVGPLLPPLPKPRAPRAPTRASIERRLRQAEREAKRLSDQLAAIDAKASDTE